MINYQPYAIRENGNELYIPDIQENEYNYFIERLNDNDRELIKELTNAGFDISKIKTTSKDRSDFTSELNLAFDWYWDEHSEEIIENELDELEYR